MWKRWLGLAIVGLPTAPVLAQFKRKQEHRSGQGRTARAVNRPGANFSGVDGRGLSLVVQDVSRGVGVAVVVPTWCLRRGVVRYFLL